MPNYLFEPIDVLSDPFSNKIGKIITKLLNLNYGNNKNRTLKVNSFDPSTTK